MTNKAMVEKRMRLIDIAKIANVSPASVSIVYKGKRGVSDEKRNIISKLLNEYGYSVAPNDNTAQKNIRFLKYVKHSFLTDGNTGFVTSIMDSIEQECRVQGYNLLMTTVNSANLVNTLESLELDPPDGILLLGTEMEQSTFLEFKNLQYPIVVVDNPLEYYPMSSVTMDNRCAMYESVRYLKNLGHPRIGFLSNELPSSNCQCRENAFLQASKDEGYRSSDTPVFPVHPTLIGAYNSMTEYLKQNVDFPSSIIANNDCMALGAAKAFKDFGIQIPRDISLIGFDGIQFSEISDPPLTTTAVPCFEIGTLAVQLLCRQIEQPDFIPVKIAVTTKMIERDSASHYKQRHTKTGENDI